MRGAPQVITNPYQQIYTSDPNTDVVAQVIRSKNVAQQVPVYQPSYQFSVPGNAYNRGWIAPDVPTIPGPTYVSRVEAPEVPYVNKSYAKLIQKAATPQPTSNRIAQQLTAPSIETNYTR
jgi:hypothetical protein